MRARFSVSGEVNITAHDFEPEGATRRFKPFVLMSKKSVILLAVTVAQKRSVRFTFGMALPPRLNSVP